MKQIYEGNPYSRFLSMILSSLSYTDCVYESLIRYVEDELYE